MKHIIGIDLGGTRIKAGLVSEADFTVKDEITADTNPRKGPSAVIHAMAACAEKLRARNGAAREEILGVGLSCPGLIEAETGTVIYSNNFGWSGLPVRELLEAELRLPVYIENDANCALLGEVRAGAAKDCRNVVVLTLGTGVGSGILANGRLLKGTGCGGVAGHLSIVSGGRKCTCGKRGCLEAYVSATALIRKTRRVMALHPDSALWEACGGRPENVTGETAFTAAVRGDAAAKGILREYFGYLGDGISGLVSLFRPEIVLLSGGICNQGEGILQELMPIVRSLSYAGDLLEMPRMEIAALKNSAGWIGAASLVAYRQRERKAEA